MHDGWLICGLLLMNLDGRCQFILVFNLCSWIDTFHLQFGTDFLHQWKGKSKQDTRKSSRKVQAWAGAWIFPEVVGNTWWWWNLPTTHAHTHWPLLLQYNTATLVLRLRILHLKVTIPPLKNRCPFHNVKEHRLGGKKHINWNLRTNQMIQICQNYRQPQSHK